MPKTPMPYALPPFPRCGLDVLNRVVEEVDPGAAAHNKDSEGNFRGGRNLVVLDSEPLNGQ